MMRPDYRAMVEQFVKCMVPHPAEHPSMHAAWIKGKELLASDPCDPVDSCKTDGQCWNHSEWEKENPRDAIVKWLNTPAAHLTAHTGGCPVTVAAATCKALSDMLKSG